MTNSSSEGNGTPEDPWEEEIDLRELIVGVLRKWYVWVSLPVLVTLVAGTFMYTMPDTYQVTAIFEFRRGHPAFEKLDLTFPSETIVRHQLLARSNLRPLYRENFLRPDQNLEEAVTGFRRSVEVVAPDSHYQVNYVTSRPDSAAKLLNAMVEEFEKIEARSKRGKLNQLQKTYREELAHIRKEWKAWKKSLGLVTADTTTGSGLEEAGSGKNLLTRLGGDVGPVPQELEILQRNREFIQRINETEERLFWVENLLESPANLIKVYPAESPGDPVAMNRSRNTLLAGAVTFLLAIFGVAFWEIL